MLDRLKRADVPQELVFGWPRAVLYGDEKLVVEQHQGVFACAEDEIVLRTLCGRLVVSGAGLSLTRFDGDGLVVCGKIQQLRYLPKG